MSSIISGKLMGNNKYLLMETAKFRIKLLQINKYPRIKGPKNNDKPINNGTRFNSISLK